MMLSAANANAQPVAVAAGYNLPVINLAPGQVVTIFVDGLNLPPETDVRARGVPLPRQLAGVSATLVQKTTPLVPFENQAALLRVVTFSNCGGADPMEPCPQRAAVTLQVPFEAIALGSGRIFPLFNDLFFVHDGVRGPGVRVRMFEPNIHLLDACDSTHPEWPVPNCTSILTNAEGEFVGRGHLREVRPGATIVAYAFGLGATEPRVPTGRASPSPPALLQSPDTQRVQFEFLGLGREAVVQVAPAFVGLTPRFVGLYQINIPVPQPPDGLPPCVEVRDFNTRLSVIAANHPLSPPGDSVEFCIGQD